VKNHPDVGSLVLVTNPNLHEYSYHHYPSDPNNLWKNHYLGGKVWTVKERAGPLAVHVFRYIGTGNRRRRKSTTLPFKWLRYATPLEALAVAAE